jgi:hypothetical protein
MSEIYAEFLGILYNTYTSTYKTRKKTGKGNHCSIISAPFYVGKTVGNIRVIKVISRQIKYN